jgi:putative PIN family toxin of toxin-antitoxin system
MRIVLDTNVLVAGLLKPFGPPAQLVRLVLDGRLECAVDARILAEYDDVVHRPRLNIDPAKLESVLREIRAGGLPVASVPLPAPLPDPTDEAFVEVGLAGGARCLVTGNVVHFPEDRCLGLPVLRPAELVDVLRRVQAPATADGPPHSIDPPALQR